MMRAATALYRLLSRLAFGLRCGGAPPARSSGESPPWHRGMASKKSAMEHRLTARTCCVCCFMLCERPYRGFQSVSLGAPQRNGYSLKCWHSWGSILASLSGGAAIDGCSCSGDRTIKEFSTPLVLLQLSRIRTPSTSFMTYRVLNCHGLKFASGYLSATIFLPLF